MGEPYAVFRRISFTGTRPPKDGFRPGEIALIHSQLDDLDPLETAIAQGGCVGVDAIVAEAAFTRGFFTVTFLPGEQFRQFTAEGIDKVSHDLIDTGKRPIDRNWDIVNFCEELRGVALYERERQFRSGTWAAIRLGNREGKLKRIVTLRPRDGIPHIDHYEGVIPA